MLTNAALELRLEDLIGGKWVTPSHIPLPLLNKFNEQVASFLRGSNKGLDLDNLPVAIADGSYKLIVSSTLLIVGLASDLVLLANKNLDDMDPKRAEVVEEWQKAAHKNLHRRYGLTQAQQSIAIAQDSDFHRERDGQWLSIEKYIFGKVVDLGGATSPNLHLRMADGSLPKIRVTEEKIRQLEKNLVYSEALLRVRAEQELTSGRLRNIHLLDFADYKPEFDAAAFEAMTAKGRKAWADVPSGAQWVEELRGAA